MNIKEKFKNLVDSTKNLQDLENLEIDLKTLNFAVSEEIKKIERLQKRILEELEELEKNEISLKESVKKFTDFKEVLKEKIKKM